MRYLRVGILDLANEEHVYLNVNYCTRNLVSTGLLIDTTVIIELC